MDNSEYEIIVNCLTRGRHPAGISNEQKRAVRRKVKDRSANTTNSNKFVAEDGVLYFVDNRPDGLGVHERRAIRMEEKMGILQDCHEAEIGEGQFKRDKTYGKISEGFYCHGLMSDVKQYVSTCDVCQRVDGRLGKQHAELHPIPVSDV